MVVAGRVAEDDDVAIMMVEAEATETAIGPGRATARPRRPRRSSPRASRPPSRSSRTLCAAQAELADPAAKPTAEFPTLPRVRRRRARGGRAAAVRDELAQALTIAAKQEREAELDRIKAELAAEQVGDQFEGREKEIGDAFRSLTKKLVRQRVLRDKVRIDGRGLTDIRAARPPRSAILPRVHGSALFERGETQILGVTTLNMLGMEQKLDTLAPENRKRYMHNYNFPPYSTGETGRVGLAEAARDRPRRARRAGAGAGAADPRGVPVRDPSGVRGAQLQRFHLDGLGLRVHDVAAERRACR